MNQAARFRIVETTVIGVLTMLVCLCAVLAPVLQRAIVQSTLNTALTEGSARQTGVVITVVPPDTGYAVTDPKTLAPLVPAMSRPLFGPPVGQASLAVVLAPYLPSSPTTTLLYRDQVCHHIRIVSGTCSMTAGDVMVSASDAARRHWAVGTRLSVREEKSARSAYIGASFRVAGTYVQVPGSYWFDTTLSSGADQASSPVADALLTGYGTLVVGGLTAAGDQQTWRTTESELDLPIRHGQVGTTEFLRRAAALPPFLAVPSPGGAGQTDLPQITASSSLGDIASDLTIARSQSRLAVPLLMAQLVFVLLCVLWLVLVALTEQRRPELAVMRLRGHSPGSSRRLLTAETLPTVAVAAGAGAVLSLPVSYALRHWWLLHDPGFSARPVDLLCFLAAAGVVALLVVAAVLRPSRQPIAALLRAIPARASGLVLGTVEAMLVAVGLTAYVALATGQVTGPVALVIPSALAAALGVVMARLVPVVMGGLGRSRLRRGRVTAGVGMIEAARRPTARWLIPLTALATASLVFGITASSIGRRNQAIAGGVDNGAPAVAVVGTQDGPALRRAVAVANAAGVDATPVVRVPATDPARPDTVAVVPDQYRRIADLVARDRSSAAWSDLPVTGSTPVGITGRSLTARADIADIVHGTAGGSYELGLRVLAADGSRVDASVATFALGRASTQQVSTYVPCGDGCHVLSLIVKPFGTGSGSRGTVTLHDLRVDGKPVTLGSGDLWKQTQPAPAELAMTPTADGMRLAVVDAGLDELDLQAASAYLDPPALLTPDAAATASGGVVEGTGLDGLPLPMRSVGRVAAVPAQQGPAVVVSLDALLAGAMRIGGNAVAGVYLARDDPRQLEKLATVLRADGITIQYVSHAKDLTRAYEHSAAAWSLRLAVWTALTALLLALLGLVVLVANSWRGRSWDLAALRMSGLTDRAVRSVAIRELVPLAVLGALVGGTAGVWGGLTAIRTLPLFTHPPAAGVVDLSLDWRVTAVTVALSVLVIGGGAVVMALWTARRSTLVRLREPA